LSQRFLIANETQIFLSSLQTIKELSFLKTKLYKKKVTNHISSSEKSVKASKKGNKLSSVEDIGNTN